MERAYRENPRPENQEATTHLTLAQIEGLGSTDERLAAIRTALEECLQQEHFVCPESLRNGTSPFVDGSPMRNGDGWRYARDRHGRRTKSIKGGSFMSKKIEAYAWEYEPDASELLVAKGMYAEYDHAGPNPRKTQTVATYWLQPALLCEDNRLKSIRDRSSREVCAKYVEGEKAYAYILEYDLAPNTESPDAEPVRILRKHISARFKEDRAVEASILDRPAANEPATELVIIRSRQGGLQQEIRQIDLDSSLASNGQVIG